jgi:CBS-domain-containing membrane protein
LLCRRAAGKDAPVNWLRSLFAGGERPADSYSRTHGLVTAGVMTRDVVTVAPDAIAENCAHPMEGHRVKRLPILQDGPLVGIVSRADLLEAIMEPAAHVAVTSSDAQILAVLRPEPREQASGGSLHASSSVQDGVVTLVPLCANRGAASRPVRACTGHRGRSPGSRRDERRATVHSG